MSAHDYVITGRVQGVFFRAHAKETADRLGVKGWVRNEADGSVHIHAEGGEEELRAMEAWCRRGPPEAQVDAVEVRQEPDEGSTSFVILV